MLNRYPQDIRLWLREKGGVENMPHREGWWILWAHELWDMGYRKCEPEELPVPMTITKSAKNGNGWLDEKGFMASGSYCVPGSDKAPAAIPKKDWCPAGWRDSGSYCIR